MLRVLSAGCYLRSMTTTETPLRAKPHQAGCCGCGRRASGTVVLVWGAWSGPLGYETFCQDCTTGSPVEGWERGCAAAEVPAVRTADALDQLATQAYPSRVTLTPLEA